MIGLDRLLERDGVVAAGQFADDGSVVRAVGDMGATAMERVARICAAHQTQARETAKELDQTTPLKWKELNGWVLWGGEYALCVAGNTGVFVRPSRADFNQLLVDLFGPPAAGKRVD
jgi:roadblock/LC7 domain-containing protein